MSSTPAPASAAARLFDHFVRPNIGTPTAATMLVRLAVGFVFVSSGTVKFLFDNQGPLRFTKISLPAPATLAFLVGPVEIVAGTMMLVGLAVRLAALPLVVDMLVAV